MQKFRFKLQAALDYAEHREEVEEMALNALLAERHRLSEQQLDLQKRLRRAEEELSAKKEILPDEILIYDRYIVSLRRRLEDLARRLRTLEDRLRRQRDLLVEAAKKRKTLARLREQKLQDHTRQSDRSLQRESDELYLSRLGR